MERRSRARARAFAVALAIVLAPSLVPAVTPPALWSPTTTSPDPIGEAGLDPLERVALDRCGPGERGLAATARTIVGVKVTGLPMPEPGAIAFAQRAAGEPHPWARAWAIQGRTLGAQATTAALDAWLADDKATLRRCGVASGVGRDGSRVLVVVSVDALADLAPLPTRARVGQWLTVDARLRVAARGGKVMVLGPNGAPRPLPTSFEAGRLRARFAPDAPGEFAVQVTADLASGPRPVLEASVFADVTPPAFPSAVAAPGEDAEVAGGDDRAALARMVSAARAWEGLPPLARDRRLDDVARDHALRMARGHVLAHDAGDGDPIERLRAAGVSPREAGENVAHAATVALAHRAMWASPSHRANMLRGDFDRMGVGVARDETGDAWVVEVFVADSL